MAQIELRNATLRVVDGYSNTALVNDASPANGDTQLDIDGLGTAGIIPIGTRFTMEDSGANHRHYVTNEEHNQVDRVTVDATSGNFTITVNAQTTASIPEGSTAAAVQAALEALSNVAVGDVAVSGATGGPFFIEFKGVFLGIAVTTSVADVDLAGGGTTVVKLNTNAAGQTNRIYFTPALFTAEGLPDDNDDVIFAGRTIEIKIGEGNLTYNEQRTMEYKLDRGELDTVREGDDIPMEVALDFVWEEITASATDDVPSFEDALKKRGVAANWTSSSSDACEPFAVDLEIEHEPPCGDQEIEVITLPDFRYESLNHNLRDATVAVAGKCNSREATVVRYAS